MPAFSVDLDALDDAVARMQTFEAQIEQQLADLDRRIAALQADWEGSAADAEAIFHAQWLAGATEMRDGLAAMKAAATTAHGNYSSATAANRSMWQAG